MGNACGAGAAPVKVGQGLLVLIKAMQAERAEGKAALQLIQTAAPAPRASEPGKGGRVDVTA